MRSPRGAQKEPAPAFGEYAVRSVADHIRARKLASSTAEHLHTTLKTHLIPMFGHLRVDRIEDDQIMAIKSLDLVAGTINNILQVLARGPLV